MERRRLNRRTGETDCLLKHTPVHLSWPWTQTFLWKESSSLNTCISYLTPSIYTSSLKHLSFTSSKLSPPQKNKQSHSRPDSLLVLSKWWKWQQFLKECSSLMVIGVFYCHEIANSSPAGQNQMSSLLSHQALFIASLCPLCGDGLQQNLIFHEHKHSIQVMSGKVNGQRYLPLSLSCRNGWTNLVRFLLLWRVIKYWNSNQSLWITVRTLSHSF